MPSELAYLRLEWECDFAQDVSFPAFKGSMLRGALGHALKATVCAVRVKICEPCLLRPHCLYARIFEYKAVPEQGRLAQAALPHPYVLEYPTEAQHFGPERPLVFQLLLFGSYTETVPYWIYSVQQMGAQGLGPRQADGQRATFSLRQLRAAGEVLYDSSQETVKEPTQLPQLRWEESPDEISRLRLQLRTPLRTKDRGQFATRLDFPLLVRLMLRRLQALQEAFGVRLEPENVRELLGQAHTVEVVEDRLYWQEQTRYSQRQRGPQQMGGLLGEITFAGDLRPFWPLLQIAQVVHLGKETSFGLGQLEVTR